MGETCIYKLHCTHPLSALPSSFSLDLSPFFSPRHLCQRPISHHGPCRGSFPTLLPIFFSRFTTSRKRDHFRRRHQVRSNYFHEEQNIFLSKIHILYNFIQCLYNESIWIMFYHIIKWSLISYQLSVINYQGLRLSVDPRDLNSSY